eukprot:jgi/Botrbrau1/21698/Bobra.43_1s0094.1
MTHVVVCIITTCVICPVRFVDVLDYGVAPCDGLAGCTCCCEPPWMPLIINVIGQVSAGINRNA